MASISNNKDLQFSKITKILMLALDQIEMLCANRDVEPLLENKMVRTISQTNKLSIKVMEIDVSSFKICA